MVNASSAQKSRLTITACSVNRLGVATADGPKFQVMLNPAEFSNDLTVISGKDDAIGKPGQSGKFAKYGPETVSFALVLDSTGVVPYVGSQPAPVAGQIKLLRSIVYEYDGAQGGPRVVKIQWGTFAATCRLKSMSVQYTLFKPSGAPLRAKLQLSFEGYAAPVEQSARAAQRAPDQVNIIEVRAGDTLPLLCERVYQESSYYLQVARANNLTSFRNIQPGSVLRFPARR